MPASGKMLKSREQVQLNLNLEFINMISSLVIILSLCNIIPRLQIGQLVSVTRMDVYLLGLKHQKSLQGAQYAHMKFVWPRKTLKLKVILNLSIQQVHSQYVFLIKLIQLFLALGSKILTLNPPVHPHPHLLLAHQRRKQKIWVF